MGSLVSASGDRIVSAKRKAVVRDREEAVKRDREGAVEPASEPGAPLLSVEDLRVELVSGLSVVRGVSLRLDAGRTLGIVGESGSGKSVTARAIMGLLPRDTWRVGGSVRLRGRELVGLAPRPLRRVWGNDVAMVFQDPMRSFDPTMRVGDQIVEAMRSHLDIDRGAARARAIHLLRMVRVPAAEDYVRLYPHQLSGGMRQRVMIAIALSCSPGLLIADEVTTALDVTTQAHVMQLLKDLQSELGMALVLITHDIRLASAYTDEVVVMYAGRIVERAPTAALLDRPRMPYTRALLDSVPRMGMAPHEPLSVIGGRPADPTALPPGCPFHPRCSFVAEVCRESEPASQELEPDHLAACWFPL